MSQATAKGSQHVSTLPTPSEAESQPLPPSHSADSGTPTAALIGTKHTPSAGVFAATLATLLDHHMLPYRGKALHTAPGGALLMSMVSTQPSEA